MQINNFENKIVSAGLILFPPELTKYLDKSGIINKKVEKKSRNSQEIYKTG